MSLGKISIKDLKFDCIIGTLPFERENKQPIILNVNLWLDFSLAARNEDLIHSIDYAEFSKDLQSFICKSCFLLEETLVVETAKYVLKNYPKAEAVEISVSKPLAIPNASGAESTIKISR